MCVCLQQNRKSMLSPEATRNLLVCFLWVLKNVDRRTLKQWWSDMPMSRLNQLLEILYYCVSNFEYKVGTRTFFISKSSFLTNYTGNSIIWT